MTPERFYRLAVLLPVAVPLAAVAVLRAFGGEGGLAGGPFGGLLVALAASLTFVPPYLALAAFFLWRLRGRATPAYRRLVWRAPLLFAGVLFAGLLGVGAWSARQPLWASAAAAALFSAWAVAFGYGYVLVTQGLLAWLSRRGRVREADGTGSGAPGSRAERS